MAYHNNNYEKKKVLHIANKNALGGGIGTVIDYLKEGINGSEDFQTDTLFTTYSLKRQRQGKALYKSNNNQIEKNYSQSELESLLQSYDVVHVHGIPNYGILEALENVKKKEGTPKIVNTCHSSVKQEFLTQYEHAQNNATNKKMKTELKELKHFYDNNILKNPAKFANTYWGSAIYRQEKIMTMSDSIQHMNESYMRDIIDEYSAHENAGKHKVIENGVKSVKETTKRPKKKRILYVGRFAREKGIDEFIDSLPQIFEKHPDAEIKLVGGDPAGLTTQKYKRIVEEKLRSYFNGKQNHDVNNYLKRIHFTGWVTDKEELKKHYQWTDYLIVPSKAESFCLVATEALMHNRVPIITKTKAMDDLYVSKGIAFGIDEDKRHAEGIAETVNNILDNHKSEEHDKMAEKGRKFALENYSYEAMIKKQLESYRELLGHKKNDKHKRH